jgi:hypothetical protein
MKLLTIILAALTLNAFASTESLSLEDCAKGNQDKRTVVSKSEDNSQQDQSSTGTLGN